MAEEARFLRMDPESRKANLVAATLRCLKKYGFVGTSIRKICAEAGVSVGLISHHYAGKDELVAEAYLQITGQVMGLLRESVASSGGGARQHLSAFFEASFSPGMLDPELLEAWLAFWGAVKNADAINQAHDHSYGEYRTIMGDALKLLAEEEGWDGFDSGLAAIGLSALLDGLWLECGLNPNTFTPAQGVQICEAWVDGLQMGGYKRFIED